MTSTRVQLYRQAVTGSYAWVVDRDHREGVPTAYTDFEDGKGDEHWTEVVSSRRPTWGPPEAPADLLDILIRAKYNGWQFRLRGVAPNCELLYSGRIRFADISMCPWDVDERASLAPLNEFGKVNECVYLEYKIESGWVAFASGDCRHD